MVKFKYHILLASFLLSLVLWLSLNLYQVYEIEKLVPVRINIEKPYAVSGNIPLNLDVKFKGTGWNLIRLFTSFNQELTYNASARNTESFIILTKQYLENNPGLSQDLSIISVYPETLFVNIERYEEKYVKLVPQVSIECREGYQVVGKPVLEPDSIKIGGSVNLLKNISSLKTQYQSFTNVNASIIKTIRVSDSLSNLLWRSQSEVKLTVNIELTAEKEFRDIEIRVANLPSDKEVLLIPQTVTIRLKGGVNQLASVDAGKINAVIEYNDIVNDTSGALTPVFMLPQGCTLSAVNPEKIQYVIRKKPV